MPTARFFKGSALAKALVSDKCLAGPASADAEALGLSLEKRDSLKSAIVYYRF